MGKLFESAIFSINEENTMQLFKESCNEKIICTKFVSENAMKNEPFKYYVYDKEYHYYKFVDQCVMMILN